MNELYFNQEIAAAFARAEVNPKYAEVADIVDRVIAHELRDAVDPLFVAELGGGAHPNVYDRLFHRLISGKGVIDWVDFSQVMIDLARSNLSTERSGVTRFVSAEILGYLSRLDDLSLDLAIMKYTFDHVQNIDFLFGGLSAKLRKGGRLVATMTTISPELRSCSRNARYVYRGSEFPDNETRILYDGEPFVIRFFKESGNPKSGYVEGAEVTKFYHSPETIQRLARKYGFELFLDAVRNLIPIDSDQGVLILRK